MVQSGRAKAERETIAWRANHVNFAIDTRIWLIYIRNASSPFCGRVRYMAIDEKENRFDWILPNKMEIHI